MRYGKVKFAALTLLLYLFSCIFAMNIFAEHSGDYTAACADFEGEGEDNVAVMAENIKISSRLYELFFKKDKKEELKLAVGGGVFGIRIKEEGALVTETRSGSPLRVGDRILKINGALVSESRDIENCLKNCSGKPISLTVIRSGKELSLSVTPMNDGGEYKLGVSLRTVASGIGTVSFIDPETKAFGGLGHGVCESVGGELIPIEYGMTTNVVLGGVKKGECGKPGELSGILGKRDTGSIVSNTECGVFGILSDFDISSAEILPVAEKSELSLGKAEIISTVKNGRTAKYDIEITEIDYDSCGSKSFKIKVIDPTLIALTGGIVRGMSGSPIIQNGKLVGAVTHVMVADPTEGYGIFIENMLSAAQSVE